MQKTFLKFGLYGGITILVLFLIEFYLLGDLSFADKEIFGNLSIFISTLFVFFGIRSYRNNYNNGFISFGRGLGLGMLITLIPALFFGIFNAVYVLFIYPDFYSDYEVFMRADLARQYSGPELAAKLAEMEEMMAMFENNLFLSSLLMAFTVILIGFITTLISAIILRKSPPAEDKIVA